MLINFQNYNVKFLNQIFYANLFYKIFATFFAIIIVNCLNVYLKFVTAKCRMVYFCVDFDSFCNVFLFPVALIKKKGHYFANKSNGK